MDFYVIPPLSNNELMHSGIGNRYFCLAQLYNSNKQYREFFHNLPNDAWITLDNGAGDHDLVSEELLLDIVQELRPNEVIPPDVLFDSFQTISNAKSFISKMKSRKLYIHTNIFFCPQGKTLTEWLLCYDWGLNNDDVAVLGMSKLALPKAVFGVEGDKLIMESRHIAFIQLKAYNMLRKPIHLLGMGDPREFQYYFNTDKGSFIRSSDSCNSIWSAMNQLEWVNNQFDRVPTPKDYFDRELSQEAKEIAEQNISYLQLFG